MEAISEVRGTVIGNLQKDNEKLKEDLLLVRQAVDKNEQAADKNEQKSRTSCLLIHGVEETVDENTDDICMDIINQRIGVNITIDEIERSHRVGPKKHQTSRRTKPRPVIIRFASMRKRIEVYKNKKNLKGMNILITESLTAMQLRCVTNFFKKRKLNLGIETFGRLRVEFSQ